MKEGIEYNCDDDEQHDNGCSLTAVAVADDQVSLLLFEILFTISSGSNQNG